MMPPYYPKGRLWQSRPSASWANGALTALCAVVVLAFSLLAAPVAAHADSPSGWSFPLPHNAAITPMVDGSVLSQLQGGSLPAGSNLLEEISPSGASVWHLPAADGRFVDYGSQASDATGVQYYHLHEGGSQYLVANDHGTERWRVPVTNIASSRVTVGANGQVYTLSDEGSSNTALHGYSAQTGADLFAPVPLDYWTYGYVGRLFAYNGGLVADSGLNIMYFSYAGHLVSGPYSLGQTENGSPIGYHDVSVSATGDLFSITSPVNQPLPDCPDSTYSSFIAKVTPSGVA